MIDQFVESVGARVFSSESLPLSMWIFGDRGRVEIANTVASLCIGTFKSPPVTVQFFSSSVKIVFGLILSDRRHVVLKIFQPTWSYNFLKAVNEIAEYLAMAGFPCPLPIDGPLRIGESFAQFEQYLPAASLPEPCERRWIATGLHTQIALLSSLRIPAALRNHPQKIADGSIYPRPHTPNVTFASGSNTKWIDEIASHALRVRERKCGYEEVIGHMDWNRKNVRLDATKLKAVFDLDSLAVCSEPVVVGQAAANWALENEKVDDPDTLIHEIQGFIADYECAKENSFDAAELDSSIASALWLVAYAARTESALGYFNGRACRALRKLPPGIMGL